MLIIHTADNHLDAPLSSLPPEISLRRKADRRRSFSKIIDFALEKKADCILISGDLTDSDKISPSLSAFLFSEFSRLGNISVFIALGNHDYGIRNEHFPGNVHIFSSTPETFTVGDATITGASFSSKTAAFEALIPPASGSPSILCLHGDIFSESEYNPLNKDFLLASGYDYIALGHVHEFHREKTMVYPGCHDGAGFDEQGEKGFVVLNIDKYSSFVEFVPSSSAIYKVINCDISDFSSLHEIISFLQPLVIDSICKIVLNGTLPDNMDMDTGYILSSLSDSAEFVKIIDKTQADNLSQSRIMQEFSKIISEEDDKISALATKYAISAVKGVDFEL